jgi:pyrophosphatase PpaX
MKAYKALIFDVDGTLINTDLYVVANYLHIFTDYPIKKVPSLEEIVYFSGPPLKEVLEKYYPKDMTEDLAKEFSLWSRGHANYLSSLYPDEIRVLIAFKNYGYKLGLVSSKSKAALDNNLAYFGLDKIIQSIFPIEKCPIPKPDPSGLLCCAEELEVSKEEVLYIGDSQDDVIAAKRGKMDSALVTWGLKKDQDKIPPDMEFKSFVEIERKLIYGN